MDYLLFAILTLAASSIGIPLLQFVKESGRTPAYVLMAALALAIALVAGNTLSPQPVAYFGTLLSSDSLGGIFALVTMSVTLFVSAASLTLYPTSNSPSYYSLLSFALWVCFCSHIPRIC